MAHQNEENGLNREERQYLDYITHGDDFNKIEIYRAARKWYQKALDLHLHDEEVLQKINACNANIRSEVKAINIIAIVVVVVVIGFLVCNSCLS